MLLVGCNSFNSNIKDNISVSNFKECEAAGNPVMESYPRQCRDQAGQLFVEEIDQTNNPSSSLQPESPRGVEGEGVFCTMDAKMCPDGSSVGRIPPSCEFAPCPK